MTDVAPDSAGRYESTKSEELSTAIFTSFDELAAVRDEWDEFVERSGSDIYFTFDWLETWWTYYGRDRSLRCFLIRKARQPIAALPFLIERFGLGPFSIRVAKFVGADFTIPVFSPAIEPDHLTSVLRTVWEDLFTQQKCDTVSLSPLSGKCRLADAAEGFCAQESGYRVACNDSVVCHTMFELPDSFDDYLNTLSSQTRSNYRRYMRKLSRNHVMEQHVVRGKDTMKCFDAFVALHEQQWQAENRLGHFGDWPDSYDFNRTLVEKLGRKNQILLHEVKADGETISLMFGFVLSDRNYWRLPARKVGANWDKGGIGWLTLMMMLEALVEDNVRFVEAGPGHYDYKVKLGAVEQPLRRFIVSSSKPVARYKTTALLYWSHLLHLFYYRIWFMKVAPRLGLPRRALWRTWIKSRL